MIGSLQTPLIYILSALFVLTVVVTVHEFGHFLAARLCGVKVDRFSIGFGRAIVSFKDRSGVDWRIGWLPLGGYVRFAGDESAASVPDHEDLKHLRAQVEAREGPQALQQYFHFKPVWQRAIVVAAGPFANFVLSTALFAVIFMWIGQVLTPLNVTGVVPNGPAARAGVQAGDVVLEADGERLRSFRELQQHVALRANAPVTLLLQRGEREVVVNLTPEPRRVKDDLGVYNEIGTIGLIQEGGGAVQRIRLNPVDATVEGARQTWDVIATTAGYLGRLVRGEVPADQLGGILRIGHTAGGYTKMAVDDGRTSGEVARGVAFTLIQLTAFLSVSIGFMNLLPVPVLDGGHLVFYAYEAVARRPLAARVQEVGYRLGLALLLGLMLFATWNDFQNLRLFQRLGDLVS